MKIPFIFSFFLFSILLIAQSRQQFNPQVDFSGFLDLSQSANDLRKTRLVSLERFLELASQEDAIILDTRSRAAYETRHTKGAVHLNFSDFTAAKLAKVIPSKSTKILIYCNNNFMSKRSVSMRPPAPRLGNQKEQMGLPFEVPAFPGKLAPLALNIPTFINLFGYGYTNIYELGELLVLPNDGLEMEGTFEDLHKKFGK